MVVVTALILFLVISYVVLKILGLDQRTYLGAVMIPNTGNVGLPLCFLAFGELGLAFAVIVYTLVSLTQFTLGLAIASGSFSPIELSKNPLIFSVLCALFVLFTGFKLPGWIVSTVHIFGQFAIPLMLIMLGVSLAKLRITSLPRNLVLSFVRLTMGIVVGLFVSYIFGLEGVAKGVVILECSMPAAVFNYMLAVRFQNG
mgnify:CR=1 FL=1